MFILISCLYIYMCVFVVISCLYIYMFILIICLYIYICVCIYFFLPSGVCITNCSVSFTVLIAQPCASSNLHSKIYTSL